MSAPYPSSGLPHGDITVEVYGRSDVGRTREHNEDAFALADLTAGTVMLASEPQTYRLGERGLLFMVADGMGGAAAGELASAMAVDVVLEELRNRWMSVSRNDAEAFAAALRAATEVANLKIHRFAGDHPEHRGMGTTATIAGLLADRLYLVQVGDSRAYLVRDGVARQITKDQSLMQKLIEAGEITAEEAEHSERRNIILQALGPEAIIRTDLTHQHIRHGDTLVLCSDGLSGQMRVEDIAYAIAADRNLASACARLIDLANNNGGPDNITVVAARFEGPGLVDAIAGDTVGHAVYPLADERTPAVPIGRFMGGAAMRDTPPRVAAVNPAPAILPASADRRTPVILALGLVALVTLAIVAYRFVVT